MSFLVYDSILWTYEKIKGDCLEPYTPLFKRFDHYAATIEDNLRRLCPWLGIIMATIRYLSIKNAMNTKYDYLAKPSFAIKSMLGSLALSSILTIIGCCRMDIVEVGPWKPAETCTGFPANFSTTNFTRVYNGIFFLNPQQATQVYNIGDGILKVILTLMFPILAFLLITELKKAEQSRKKIMRAKEKERCEKHSKTDQTTKLVTIMAITFMIAEGPLGLVYFTQGFVEGPIELTAILFELINILRVFVSLNSITHFLVCLSVSSQYQNAAKGFFKFHRST